jgi:hypothetical protein
VACGQKFNSCKTARKHKCPKAKVVRITEEAASRTVLQPLPLARQDKPAAPPTPHAPTTPSNSNPTPVVTEGSRAHIPSGLRTAVNSQTGEHQYPRTEEEGANLQWTGLWRLMD